jgi:hypothetical protein
MFTFGISDAGIVTAPANLPPDQALAYLAARAPASQRWCEPPLAQAGAPHGFTPHALPAPAAYFRALTATVLSLGPMGAKANPDAMTALLAMSNQFLRAAPWQWWRDTQVLAVQVTRPKAKRYEASLLGFGGGQYGLALYDRPGSAARVALLHSLGDTDAAIAQARGLTVLFDATPAWAAQAVGDLVGLAFVPLPLRNARGNFRGAGDADVYLLAAALGACARLHPGQTTATAEVGQGGDLTAVEVTASPVAS